MGIFEKFKIGFKKSATTFTSGLKNIIVKKTTNPVSKIVGLIFYSIIFVGLVLFLNKVL